MGLLQSVLTKMRERELDRYAAAYAVAAWISIQAASIALPAYEMPPWLMRWLIAAAVLGLPILLASVWILKKPADETSSRYGRRDALALGALALVAALTLAELGWHLSSSAITRLSAVPAPVNTSIAVLPFANTSNETSQKVFSEGVAEELIGILARNPALRVAARTSSFAFEGKNMDARAIAQKLNVHAVLEGTVRTAEGRVRIDVDLINAANGYQIWAQIYERPLNDILGVQVEIAQSIASSLTPQLTGAPLRRSLPKPISIDPDIYRTYLEAQVALYKRGAAIPEAIAKFRQVVEAVPDFAEAQAGLAYALTIQSTIRQKRNPEADTVLATALHLDPTNPLALTVAIDRAQVRSDWNGVISYGTRLRTTGSRSGIALHGLANAYSSLGFYDQSIAASREVENLDPMADITSSDVAMYGFLKGHYSTALEDTEKLIARQPDNVDNRNLKCNIAASLKRFGVAKAAIQIMKSFPASAENVEECEVFIALNSGQTVRARNLVDDIIAGNTGKRADETEIGWLLAMTGQFDRAMDWFERAADKNNLTLELLLSVQIPRAMHTTARWKAFFDRPNFKTWSAARQRAKREWGISET